MLLRHHEEKRSNPYIGNAHVLDLFRNPNSWQLFSKAQFLDQFWKFKHCKNSGWILDRSCDSVNY